MFENTLKEFCIDLQYKIIISMRYSSKKLDFALKMLRFCSSLNYLGRDAFHRLKRLGKKSDETK